MRRLLKNLDNDPVVVAVRIGIPFLRTAIRRQELRELFGSPNMAAWQLVVYFYAIIVALNLLTSFR